MSSKRFDHSLAVPSTPAALEAFRARPMHAERAVRFGSLSFGVIEHGEVASVDPHDPYRGSARGRPPVERRFGSAVHRGLTTELGLVRLGACFEADSMRTMNKEIWATRDGAVYVSLTDPDRYHLGTYFDDGSCHLTWSHANPRTQTDPGVLVSTGGTGDLREDLESHLARVESELIGGRRFIQIDEIETSVELCRHYSRHLAPLTLLAENDAVREANVQATIAIIGLGVLALAVLSLLAGCTPKEIVTRADAGSPCTRSIAEFCADPLNLCVQDWQHAQLPASWECGRGGGLSTTDSPCVAYDILVLGLTDSALIYYYDHNSGELAAIRSNVNGAFSCAAGPTTFIFPECENASTSQVGPIPACDAGVIGADASPD